MEFTIRRRQVIRWAVGAGALAGWVLSASPVTRAADEPPIWTGVFTAEQVARGKENFELNCARCHQHNLEGVGPRSCALG